MREDRAFDAIFASSVLSVISVVQPPGGTGEGTKDYLRDCANRALMVSANSWPMRRTSSLARDRLAR